MSLLTEQERNDIEDACEMPIGQCNFDAIEAAVIKKLAAGVSMGPESFEAWNAKQHGDPEEIGFLQALRIAYCHGQDSMEAAIAAARVQENERCAKFFDHNDTNLFWGSQAASYIRALLGAKQ